ncbi:hypothetical protein BCR43DRAFT_498857 [Syncephalastrum racemosum]|uniref:Uncharacterized protein n=1 Tax=Syncephalastrum racemosum TaxID=13706 RepID=A0A1X2H1K5_SYNRA|nr:hypothetical protein BCR43DRAFT_498857 [Syncephalastrum racemosum]
MHCETCRRPTARRPIRVYWYLDVLYCGPCMGTHTHHVGALEQGAASVRHAHGRTAATSRPTGYPRGR